ncbi:hypothetical protein ZIOFF_022377 [Zingiber officinale]|uniref:Protein FAR1-RELATED SEQUENCE n=1 Tax=Zingiber officinale TaxID=94328 RepID=A0A8J5L974_ZINOF|nr:hypothetical protein ZIOFF_022377 [Zingiber officinale]
MSPLPCLLLSPPPATRHGSASPHGHGNRCLSLLLHCRFSFLLHLRRDAARLRPTPAGITASPFSSTVASPFSSTCDATRLGFAPRPRESLPLPSRFSFLLHLRRDAARLRYKIVMEQELLIEGDVQVLGDSSSSNTVDAPQVGMYFSSEEEVRAFYKSYAQGLGFGISKLGSKKGDDGQIKYFSFGCSKNVISGNPIEKQFQSVYTNKIFKLFQNELRGLMFCNTSFVKEEGSTLFFEVMETVYGKDGTTPKEISFWDSNIIHEESRNESKKFHSPLKVRSRGRPPTKRKQSKIEQIEKRAKAKSRKKGSIIDRKQDDLSNIEEIDKSAESQRLFRLDKELLVPNDVVQTMERTRSFEKPIDLLQMHADLLKEGKSAKMNFD